MYSELLMMPEKTFETALNQQPLHLLKPNSRHAFDQEDDFPKIFGVLNYQKDLQSHF